MLSAPRIQHLITKCYAIYTHHLISPYHHPTKQVSKPSLIGKETENKGLTYPKSPRGSFCRLCLQLLHYRHEPLPHCEDTEVFKYSCLQTANLQTLHMRPLLTCPSLFPSSGVPVAYVLKIHLKHSRLILNVYSQCGEENKFF